LAVTAGRLHDHRSPGELVRDRAEDRGLAAAGKRKAGNNPRGRNQPVSIKVFSPEEMIRVALAWLHESSSSARTGAAPVRNGIIK